MVSAASSSRAFTCSTKVKTPLRPRKRRSSTALSGLRDQVGVRSRQPEGAEVSRLDLDQSRFSMGGGRNLRSHFVLPQFRASHTLLCHDFTKLSSDTKWIHPSTHTPLSEVGCNSLYSRVRAQRRQPALRPIPRLVGKPAGSRQNRNSAANKIQFA